MKKFILYIFVFASLGAANQAEYFFQQGVEAYQQNDFETAVTHFEAALQHGQESEALYYNLGNAYYKLDNIGRAILNYERAKRLAPADKDVDFNLQIAQLRVVDKIPSPEADFFFKLWNSIKNVLSLEQLAVLTLVLYILFIAILVMRLLLKNKTVNRTSRHAWLPVFIVLLFTASLFMIRVRQDLKVNYGVILVEKVSVVSSPAVDATEMFALHEGVKIRIIAHSGEFMRIRLTDGKDGWVPMGALEII